MNYQQVAQHIVAQKLATGRDIHSTPFPEFLQPKVLSFTASKITAQGQPFVSTVVQSRKNGTRKLNTGNNTEI
jgi:hypothetical protein